VVWWRMLEINVYHSCNFICLPRRPTKKKVAFKKEVSWQILRRTRSLSTQNEAIRYPSCRNPGNITTRLYERRVRYPCKRTDQSERVSESLVTHAGELSAFIKRVQALVLGSAVGCVRLTKRVGQGLKCPTVELWNICLFRVPPRLECQQGSSESERLP